MDVRAPRLLTAAEIKFGKYLLRDVVHDRFARAVRGREYFRRRRMMFAYLLGDDAGPLDGIGSRPAPGELRFLARHLLAQIRELFFGRGQLRC